MQSKILNRLGLTNEWAQEAGMAAITLGLGFGVMPLLIFLTGSSSLGRYEGAAPARIYDTVYQGLRDGSSAAWTVVLGPYGLYLLFKGLRLWWRASARLG
jgi:hypothetical protein